MYELYFDKVLFPIAPSQIETKVQGDNKTINLINEAEVNQIKGNRLTDFSFEIRIPNHAYPWAVYKEGFLPPTYYLEQLETFKNKKSAFKLKILRNDSFGFSVFDTSMKVTLENYTIKEDAEDLSDLTIEVELRQYKKYGTTKLKIKKKKNKKVITYCRIDTKKKKIPLTHKTKKGETLHTVSKKVYGRYTDHNANVLYKKNKAKIDKALKSKFNGKFSKRIYTSSLPAKLSLDIPQNQKGAGDLVAEVTKG